MGELIDRKYPKDDWVKSLTKGRLKKIENKIQDVKNQDNFVSMILLTELVDKFEILKKMKILQFSGKQLDKKFRNISLLRNNVAHSSDFADTKIGCLETSESIKFILELLNEF